VRAALRQALPLRQKIAQTATRDVELNNNAINISPLQKFFLGGMDKLPTPSEIK